QRRSTSAGKAEEGPRLRNDNFVSGMVTGVALGALVVLAMSPQVRRPVMEGANQLGGRMRKMWNRQGNQMAEAVDNMMPGDTM
ncbi:MAG TPA: hypothetical protein VNT75_25500, partial [Symbiobacteriaceae bacterium]|nr:hypothetical protein [Symbiobacteriaceae bacterium]